VQHAHLETHASICWFDDEQRLNVRTSSQAPFLARALLCDLYGLPLEKVRVHCARVGGGFGGKQEMLTEDLCALATLKTGRPVQFEFTREEEFTGSTSRHPMKITVRAGARNDGTLTALQLRIISNTGAYGNHGSETLLRACSGTISVYRCPNKRIDAWAVYTNLPPAGAVRGYGLSQTVFAVESAMDELARALNLDAFEFRRRNIVHPGDALVSWQAEPSDAEFGSYGLDQCLEVVESALSSGRGERRPKGEPWLEGSGFALAMHDTAPPTEHRSEARLSIDPDGCYRLSIGTPEFGNGTTTLLAQIVASVLCTTVERVSIDQGDTETSGYDTGAFASTGTVVAGNAARLAAEALRDKLLDFAALNEGVDRSTCSLNADSVDCGGKSVVLSMLVKLAAEAGYPLAAVRKAYASPRSVGFNVQGFRVAVHSVTGEIRILQSVHAADAGVVVNPMQLRGQIEGAVVQALGWALSEHLDFDNSGALINRSFRDYRIPAFADAPRTEVLFADTRDTIGPLGAKSMAESPVNPVAPALANAVANATGVRFRTLPLTPDRIFEELVAAHPAAIATSIT
jgi:CO/xanthine dehydrogenase Mo-binding subunit